MKPSVETGSSADPQPLCVDMDGTLLRTDTLQETLLAFLRNNLWRAWLLPVWWLRGRAYLKKRLADEITLPVEGLPCAAEFVEFLEEEHRRGRRIVLATAANEQTARRVAGRFRFFSEVIASDAGLNLKGERKSKRLVERFGEGGFDYAGNSRADLPVWKAARQAILVNTPSRLEVEMRGHPRGIRKFGRKMSWLENLGQVLRFHQWPKNLLLFIPVISGHELGNVEIMGRAVLGMLAFCFCAASVYVMNDLHDLETDRAHPAKRMRPFAAGTVPLGVGLTLAPALVLLAALGALFLPLMFGVYLGIYWTVATVYSWRLKEIVLLDVFILAGLYTIRVLAGHGASGIGYSNWLLGFAMFLFLSLALVKRYVEVHRIERGSGTHVAGRGYQAGDSSIIAALGLATGSLSALVLALYINSAEVRLLYSQPWVLFFICPLLLYWISRVWLLAYRGRLHDDPVVFALKDKGSYGAGALAAVFVWLASVL